MQKNLLTQDYQINTGHYIQRNKHLPMVLWMTGLSGSGKSTLANAVSKEWFDKGFHVVVLDGDNVRQGLNKDLGFSVEDRTENIRRVAEVANLFCQTGNIVITAFISPLKKDREIARNIIGNDSFREVYIDCSLEECENRDVKGLYQKARNGLIQDFTGISSPFEAPVDADIHIHTNNLSIADSVDAIIQTLEPQILTIHEHI